MRQATITRNTKETQITASLTLDDRADGVAVNTGIGFFDHMLTAFAVHAGLSLHLECKGDLEVDCHHTIEDTGIVLGQAIAEALGSRGGIVRYGSFFIPMDESLASAHVDISGRPFLSFRASFTAPMIGAMDTQMIEEFFRAVAVHSGMTLHLEVLYGENDHHKAEALFKAFGHALAIAVVRNRDGATLSTKGVL